MVGQSRQAANTPAQRCHSAPAPSTAASTPPGCVQRGSAADPPPPPTLPAACDSSNRQQHRQHRQHTVSMLCHMPDALLTPVLIAGVHASASSVLVLQGLQASAQWRTSQRCHYCHHAGTGPLPLLPLLPQSQNRPAATAATMPAQPLPAPPAPVEECCLLLCVQLVWCGGLVPWWAAGDDQLVGCRDATSQQQEVNNSKATAGSAWQLSDSCVCIRWSRAVSSLAGAG